jgi:hypothetical protein
MSRLKFLWTLFLVWALFLVTGVVIALWSPAPAAAAVSELEKFQHSVERIASPLREG